jgi:hypothetical protein
LSPNNRFIAGNSRFEKKLAAYTLAGAAVLVAPAVAKADIIVTNVNQTVNQTGTYNFNLSGVASDDITITAAPGTIFPSDPANEISASTIASAAVLMDGPPSPFTNVAALAFGSLIDPTNLTDWGAGGKLAAFDLTEMSTDGDWPANGGNDYLGFYFTGSGGLQAGWANIATTATSSGSSFTILSYAYETNANEAITAGQTAETPEPSAMALIALGGAGLLALRRRRSVNA